MRFKLIDRYIIKKFIGTYLFALLLVIVIIVIFDISERIDDFVEKKAPLDKIVFEYYLTFIPFLLNSFSPLFVFISVIFFTSKMASNTEIIAILSSGISFKRMMVPYFISAFFIFIFTLTLNHFIIPPANKTRLAFQEQYIKNKFHNYSENLHLQTTPGTIVYMSSFSTATDYARNFSVETIEGKELKSKLMSESATWDTLTNKWRVRDYTIRTLHENGETITEGASIDTAVNLAANELKRRDNFVMSMNYFQLQDYMGELRMRGLPVEVAKIENYSRTSMPFSVFVLTLIGVSLSSRKVRGGIGLHIGVGIALSFSYIMLQRFSEMFVKANIATPFVAVWIPNILFLLIAIYLYRIAPK